MKKRSPNPTPDPIDKYVGSRVRGRRVGLRMSQTKLGRAIGVTFQQIQKYENGSNRIGASNLFKIAKTLDVEVAYLYEGIEKNLRRPPKRRASGLSDHPVTDFEHDPLRSREAIELMHNYFRIADPVVRKQVFKFVKSLTLTG